MLSFSFLSFTSVHKKREICSKEKELLTVVLKESRKCLLHKSHDSTNPSFALCSLTFNIIKQLVDNAEYILLDKMWNRLRYKLISITSHDTYVFKSKYGGLMIYQDFRKLATTDHNSQVM